MIYATKYTINPQAYFGGFRLSIIESPVLQLLVETRPKLLECKPRTIKVYQPHTHTQSSLHRYKTLTTTKPAVTGEAWRWRLCSLISAYLFHKSWNGNEDWLQG